MIKKTILWTILGLLIVVTAYLSFEFFKLKKELLKVTITEEIYIQGNPKGDLVVVYFSDYECDLCRNLHPVLMEAVNEDGNIRLVQRPTAKDDWFMKLTACVYAAGKQNKFHEMNSAIVENWPIFSEKKLFSIAQDINLDVNKLSRDMSSVDVQKIIQENKNFLQMWQLPRFPALIIGQKNIVMPNPSVPITKEQLHDHFKDARSFF